MKKKRIFGILLSFALMLTMMPVLGLSQTAKATTTTTVTWNSNEFTAGSTTSKDGISIVGGRVLKDSSQVDFCGNEYLISNGSFTTDLGNFTSVTVTGGSRYGGFPGTGTGWDGNTWTGNSSTVPISGRMTDDLGGKPWTITFTIAIPTPYPLWVGGTQVTSANLSGEGWSYTPATTGENATPAKLTLNNYTFEGAGHNGAAIYAEEDLTIESKGTNTVTQTGSTVSSYGILVISGNSLTITGSGSLTSNAGTTTGNEYGDSEGIFVGKQLIIKKDTTVTATGGKYTSQDGESYGVRTLDGLTVNGSLTASGSSEVSDSYGVSTYGTMDVGETGTVNATGNYVVFYSDNMTISGSVTTADTGLYGIYSSNDVTINGDVTAAGSEQAIFGTVKNSIAGTGWTDSTGTGAGTPIAVNETGAALSYKKVQFLGHTHDFSYAASGATITAICGSDGCTLSNNTATLTITKPQHEVYGDEKDPEAGIIDSDGIKGEATVSYYEAAKSGATYTKKSVTALSGAPTNAGDYIAEITLGADNNTATASVGYTIAKADPTAKAPTGDAKYGQTLEQVSFMMPIDNTPGAWTFVDPLTTSVGSIGNNTFKMNFTPTDAGNYKSVSNVEVTVRVGKAANPATVSSTASVKKGGNTVELADNVTKNGATGAVTYAFNGNDKGCTIATDGKLTSGTTTGDVIVNVSIAADDYYEALAATPITVTITDKDPQIITTNDVTATYGDADKKVSARTSGDGSISYAVKSGSTNYIDVDASSGALTIKKVPSDGKAYVTVTAEETISCAEATKDVTVTISKKALTVKALDKSIKVGDDIPDLSNPVKDTDYTVTGLVGTDTLTNGPTLAYASQPDNTKAGTYKINASGAAVSDNYTIGYQDGTLTISEKSSGGGGTVTDPVADVVKMIDALPNPEVVTVNDEAAIKAARDAYKALTTDQKKDERLTPAKLNKLEDCEDQLEAAKKSEEEVKEAEALINALPDDPADADTIKAKAALAAFDALTPAQRAKLSDAELIKIEGYQYYFDKKDAKTKKVTLKSVKAKKGRKATATWKKNSKVSGYQLSYSTSKKFTKKTTKKATIKSYKTVKKTVKKLTAGKKYYFKIRPYTNVENPVTDKTEKVYGKWSKVKSCKAKK